MCFYRPVLARPKFIIDSIVSAKRDLTHVFFQVFKLFDILRDIQYLGSQ